MYGDIETSILEVVSTTSTASLPLLPPFPFFLFLLLIPMHTLRPPNPLIHPFHIRILRTIHVSPMSPNHYLVEFSNLLCDGNLDVLVLPLCLWVFIFIFILPPLRRLRDLFIRYIYHGADVFRGQREGSAVEVSAAEVCMVFAFVEVLVRIYT